MVQFSRSTILADHLIASKWGLAICQPLVALYDNVRTRTERSWQHSEAIRLLCLAEVEERYAAIAWRRLLRRQLLPMLSEGERNNLIMRIRESQYNDRVRINELADFAEFAVLTQGEEGEIGKARRDNDVFEAIDPRELRSTTRIGRSSSETPSDQLIKTWPHAEDHASLKLLVNAEAIGAKAAISEVEASLFPRLDALNTVMKRPEIDSIDWMGEILGWCTRAVGDTKEWYRIKHEIPQNGKIHADQYVEILEDMVPWWENRVTATLKRLKQPPPEHHASDQYDHISWGSNDPIACSLMYLDEVLATPIGSRLDAYRSDLAETIAEVWDTWPCYSHGLAITLLRPYHWATNKNLTELLVRVLKTETHSQNVELSLDQLTNLGQLGLSDLMRSLIARIETLTNPSEIAYRIGELIGNAVARYRGDGETATVLADISYLYDDLGADRSQGQSVRYPLIASIIEGVRRHLGSLNRLDRTHSELWLSIVIWGLTEWLEMGDDKRGDMPVSPVNAVREMRWDNDQRTFLLEGMTDMLLRIINEADIGAFYDMHYELRKLLEGDPRGHNVVLERATRRSLDQTLIALCRASAERAAKWRKEGRTTNDLAYVSSLTGDSTSELITLVFATAIDRENARRQLAPIIDILADAGLRDTSSRLRRRLRHS